MTKKPNNIAFISGAKSDDVVTDEDLRRLSTLQATAWAAHLAATDAVKALESRLRLGARVEATEFYWDADLRMVRSKKERAV